MLPRVIAAGSLVVLLAAHQGCSPREDASPPSPDAGSPVSGAAQTDAGTAGVDDAAPAGQTPDEAYPAGQAPGAVRTPDAAAPRAPIPESAEIDCSAPAEESVEWVACNVRDGLRSRNLAALPGFMAEAFSAGLWRSDRTTMTPEEAVASFLPAVLYVDPGLPMRFTADRALFPPLEGLLPEEVLGITDPLALAVLSDGWGPGGSGEALLVFTETEPGRFVWQGLAWAPSGFD